MTEEQLELSRAERLRLNGHATLNQDEARTWIEETGLCLFAPRRQFPGSPSPSFVEAVGGKRDQNPDPKLVTRADEMLTQLEHEGVAVRLNLSATPGEAPDFLVATWVLPYIYALRGDRDWRRIPQLTGSRQVSPLAVQVYKSLDAHGEQNAGQLKQQLGREVTEQAIYRAIAELWQQLRIVPNTITSGKPAKWQMMRNKHQKAIAEGASTSQVTAISVLASIFLQAVVAATMEEVEIFLSPLTSRGKIREVIRGLVATRQVSTVSLTSSPHYYVAGTLPEFSPAQTLYTSASIGASFGLRHDDDHHSNGFHGTLEMVHASNGNGHEHAKPVMARPEMAKPLAARPHMARPGATRPHGAKPMSTAGRGPRPAAGTASRGPARPSSARPVASRASSARPVASRSSARPVASRSGSARPAAKQFATTAGKKRG